MPPLTIQPEYILLAFYDQHGAVSCATVAIDMEEAEERIDAIVETISGFTTVRFYRIGTNSVDYLLERLLVEPGKPPERSRPEHIVQVGQG